MWDTICTILIYLSLFVLLLTIACKISPRCVYYLKLTIFYAGLLNMGIWACIYGLFHKSYETSRFVKTMLDPLLILLNIQCQVKGSEYVEKHKSYIIIANHQHALDTLTVMQVGNNNFKKVNLSYRS